MVFGDFKDVTNDSIRYNLTKHRNLSSVTENLSCLMIWWLNNCKIYFILSHCKGLAVINSRQASGDLNYY